MGVISLQVQQGPMEMVHLRIVNQNRSTGQEEWIQTFGGGYIDIGNSIKQTSDNGYIITGYTQSYGNGSRDVWLIKTNSHSNEEWNQTFGGSYIDTVFYSTNY